MKEIKLISLKTKMTIGVILICFLIGALAIFSVNRIATSIIDEEYGDKAEKITEAVVRTIDLDEVLEVKNAILDIYNGLAKDVITTTGSVKRYTFEETDPVYQTQNTNNQTDNIE